MRSGKLSAKDKRIVSGVDSAMARSKLSSDVEVWRGVAGRTDVFGDRDGDLTGAEWTEAGYASTSVAEGIGTQFSYPGEGSAPLLMRMRVPSGTGAVAMSEAPSGTPNPFSPQGELLLERGLKLRVTRDHGVTDGVHRVDVEVVPSTPDADADIRPLDPEAARDALELKEGAAD